MRFANIRGIALLFVHEGDAAFLHGDPALLHQQPRAALEYFFAHAGQASHLVRRACVPQRQRAALSLE